MEETITFAVAKLTAFVGAAVMLAGVALPAFADPVTLTMETWRSEDAKAWNEVIIPAFEEPDSKLFRSGQ